MTTIAEQLNQKLENWAPDKAAQIGHLVAEIIEMADGDAIDLLPSRCVTHGSFDLIDER